MPLYNSCYYKLNNVAVALNGHYASRVQFPCDSATLVHNAIVTLLIWTAGSSNFLTGFALYMKYIGLPNPTYVRVFNFSSSRPPDLGKVTKTF